MFKVLARYRIGISRVIGFFLSLIMIFSQPQLYNTSIGNVFLMIGFLLIMIGVLGRVFASLFMSDNRHKNVVTSGIYSITRNPLYLFSFIGTLGIVFVYSSIVFGIFVIVIYLLYYYVVIRHEENSLSDKFGLEYIDYLHSGTPRFFPKFKMWKSEDYIRVNYRVVLQTMLDAMWFFVVAMVILVILELQNFGIIPVLYNLF